MNKPLKILFMGSPEVALPSLKVLIESKDQLVAVVSQPDRPSGRGQETQPCAVARFAREHGIPLLQPEKIDDDFVGRIRELAPDLAVVVAYGKILPRSFLSLLPNRCLNVHFSLLPRYRGAAPIQWALLNDEEETGVTTMIISEKLDAGPVLLQKKIAIGEEDNAEILGARLANAGAQLLEETMEGWRQEELTPRPQNEREVTLAPSLKKEDGKIDWARKAKVIWCQVRALNPWPGAWTVLDGKRVKIHRADIVPRTEKLVPGEIYGFEPDGIEVVCGQNTLLITELQIEGKKKMSASEFLHGYPLSEGKRFGE